MADILPFIGTRFNSQLIGNLSKVVAPPYDVISPEMQARLYERHANNVVRIEFGEVKEEDDAISNRYTRAASSLRAWRSDGILIEDDRPGLYLYEQEFQLPKGPKQRRRGFFAMVKLEDYKSGAIRAHERTQDGPKADRLKLLRATQANLSPVFVICHDKTSEVSQLLNERMNEKAWEELSDEDGVTHRLWVTQKKDFVIRIRELLLNEQLFIADGHHRYETALAYRDEMREQTGKLDGRQPFDYMMMYITVAEQDGLAILPTHRVLSREFLADTDMTEALEELEEHFDLTQAKTPLTDPAAEAEAICAKVEKLCAKRTAFAMVFPNGRVIYLQLNADADPDEMLDDDEVHPLIRSLDVTLLHHHVINQVLVGNPEFELHEDECTYVRDAGEALALLKNKKSGVAVLMAPLRLETILKIVEAGVRLPHKSTYFYPKIVTGLVLRNLETLIKKAPKR